MMAPMETAPEAPLADPTDDRDDDVVVERAWHADEPSPWMADAAVPPAPPKLPSGYRDGTIPSRVAQAMLAANGLVYLSMVGVLVVEAIELSSEAWWSAIDAFWAVAEPLEIVLRLVTAAAFLGWLHRASKNAHAIADVKPQHSPSSALGVWFVPCANLWLPYQVVSEIDRVSAAEQTGATSGWVAAWWASWVAGTAVSRVLVSANPSIEVVLGNIGIQLAAAVLAIVVVERILRAQTARAERTDAHALAATFA
jgi:hypothetical protein